MKMVRLPFALVLALAALCLNCSVYAQDTPLFPNMNIEPLKYYNSLVDFCKTYLLGNPDLVNDLNIIGIPMENECECTASNMLFHITINDQKYIHVKKRSTRHFDELFRDARVLCASSWQNN
jgi:hypothetical protein